MRFEYKDSLINQIIKRDNVLGIEFVYVDQNEMNKIKNEVNHSGMDHTYNGEWLSLNDFDFVIYLDAH